MTTVEFRDGPKDVPDHVAVLLSRTETWQLTYEQAMAKLNDSLVMSKFEDVRNALIKEHFKEWR